MDTDKSTSNNLQSLYNEFGITNEDKAQPDTVLPGTFKEKCLELGDWGQRLLRACNTEINKSRGLYINTIKRAT